jgi:hypothetical protein
MPLRTVTHRPAGPGIAIGTTQAALHIVSPVSSDRERLFGWLRGSAVRRNGDLIEVKVAAANWYQPADHASEIWRALRAVRTDEEARKFVENFGPLVWSTRREPVKRSSSSQIVARRLARMDTPDQVLEIHGIPPMEGSIWQACSEVCDAAEELRQITDVIGRIRRVDDLRRTRAERHSARRWLQQRLAALKWQQRVIPVSQARARRRLSVVEHASRIVAVALADRLRTCETTISADRPGYVNFAVAPQNLRQFCFLAFAKDAAARRFVRICDACEGTFLTDVERQTYCDERCATRVRVQRHRSNRQPRVLQPATPTKRRLSSV